MVRHYFTAALRNMAADRFNTAINIIGLTVGFAVALLIALFVRDELSYDHALPGAERTYNLYSIIGQAGRKPLTFDSATAAAGFAPSLKLAFPAIESAARLARAQIHIKRDQIEANDAIYWADPDIFSLLQLPALAGDLKTALVKPDSLVLTARMARKYFGTEQALGRSLDLDSTHPMVVTAVLADFPSSTNLNAQIFASGKADFSSLSAIDRHQAPVRGTNIITHLLLRLRPGADTAALTHDIPAFLAARMPHMPDRSMAFEMVALPDVHLHPSDLPSFKLPDDRLSVYGIALVGFLIPFIATINFINLMTAHASRRIREVGVRKSAGARRRHLFLQFMGEAALQVVMSMVLALSLAELLLPVMNALLQRDIVFSYSHDLWFAAFGLTATVLAAAYPALVLARLRPAVVLRSGAVPVLGSERGRQFLVVLQFAILIGLLFAVTVIGRQMQFALGDGFGIDAQQALVIRGADCRDALKQRIAALPGVEKVACGSMFSLNLGQQQYDMSTATGGVVGIYGVPADADFLGFYGLKPLAGRLLTDKGQDISQKGLRSLVLNERAVRRLGFASPAVAIGHSVFWKLSDGTMQHFAIVGVVRDFNFKTKREPVDPTAYYVDPSANAILNVRLSAQDQKNTLDAIDRVWTDLNPGKPITRLFVLPFMAFLYGDVIRQGTMLALLTLVAVFIACLGLFAMTSFMARRRTKEIGARKAVGARNGQVVALLLWQFTKPVLWANAIAWPVAWWAMNRWLSGFAYHVAMPYWLFPAAGAATALIALLTVAGQAILVARQKPVLALRYE